MIEVKVFRTLVAVDFLLMAWGWFTDTKWMEPSIQNVIIYWAVLSACALIAVGTSLGMFFFIRPARMMYAATVVFGVFSVAWLGREAADPAEAVLDGIGNLVAGGVLTMSWISPEVSQRFLRKHADAM